MFKFPAWNTAIRMCWLCMASSSIAILAFTCCSSTAGWRGTKFSHEIFLQHLRDRNWEPPLFLLLVIGIRIECILIDSLHMMELGCTSHIIGNILVEAARRHFFGASNIEDNIELMDLDLRKYQKRMKASSQLQGPLTKERLRTNGYPKLKSKAAAARHMVGYALDLAIRMSSGEGMDLVIVELARYLCKYYEILSDNGRFFFFNSCG